MTTEYTEYKEAIAEATGNNLLDDSEIYNMVETAADICRAVAKVLKKQELEGSDTIRCLESAYRTLSSLFDGEE